MVNMSAKGGRVVPGPGLLLCNKAKANDDKKHKPARKESFSSKFFFEHNDFSYIDGIVDPNRKNR